MIPVTLHRLDLDPGAQQEVTRPDCYQGRQSCLPEGFVDDVAEPSHEVTSLLFYLQPFDG